MKYRGMIRPEIERITENANFTDDEMEIFTLLTREKSLIEISTRTNLSVERYTIFSVLFNNYILYSF